MAITANVGGVLHQLSKVSVNNGGVLKQIYGTPKDDLPLYWGGFTGDSHEWVYEDKSMKTKYKPILIGECTIDSPCYVNFTCNLTDTMTNNYSNIDNILNLLSVTANEFPTNQNIYFHVTQLVSFKTEKSISATNYFSWENEVHKTFTKNSSGAWDVSGFDFSKNNIWSSDPKSIDENKYYIYATKCAYVQDYYHNDRKIIDFSGMEMNFNFKFQTLNGG